MNDRRTMAEYVGIGCRSTDNSRIKLAGNAAVVTLCRQDLNSRKHAVSFGDQIHQVVTMMTLHAMARIAMVSISGLYSIMSNAFNIAPGCLHVGHVYVLNSKLT